MSCTHNHRAEGPETGYTHGVSTPGKTDECKAAHGGITYTETCLDCGRTRRVNANGRHREVSAWGRAESW